VSSTKGDNGRYALLMCSIIITPLVSVAYLIIFLKIEPHAFHHFKKMFYLDNIICPMVSVYSENDNNNSNNNNNRSSDAQTLDSHHSHNKSCYNDKSIYSDNCKDDHSSIGLSTNSTLVTNPSQFIINILRDSFSYTPTMIDDRSELELNCILEHATPNPSESRRSHQGVVIETTINSNIHP